MLAFNLIHHSARPCPSDALLEALLAGPFHSPRSSCLSRPRVTLADSGNAFIVTVRAPGVSCEELKVEYGHGEVLSVVIKAKAGTFTHQIKMPSVDAEAASATHEDGVLTITLPKQPTREPTRIEVTDTINDDGDIDEDDGDDDDDKAYVLTVAAPGVRASDICIDAKHGAKSMLSVTGETCRAGRIATVNRTFALPREVDAANATATHIDGLLTIRMPTRSLPASTSISINTLAAATKPDPEIGAAKASTPCEDAPEAGAQALTEAAEQADNETKAEDNKVWLADWDALLEDMEEMGFYDRERNRALLAKNSGSIKLAVKELVASAKK